MFNFEEQPIDASLAEVIWRTRSGQATPGTFTSAAVSHWELTVVRQRGQTQVTVRGPETHATPAPIPQDAEFLGIRFKLGTALPHLPTRARVDGAVVLPNASSRAFWLNGSAWPVPDFGHADVFVDRLVRRGLLTHDPLVGAVLRGEPVGLSPRSVQRRFLEATGLTHGAVRQIEQARHAAALLEQGVSIPDVVYLAGYFDQPHLTRALKHRMGQTPAHIVRAAARR